MHTDDCRAAAAKAAARAAYTALHPRFCRTCNGTGSIHYAATRDDPGCDDPCSVCVEQGVCPVCGEQALDDDGNICFACGYDGEHVTAAPDDTWECFGECNPDLLHGELFEAARMIGWDELLQAME